MGLAQQVREPLCTAGAEALSAAERHEAGAIVPPSRSPPAPPLSSPPAHTTYRMIATTELLHNKVGKVDEGTEPPYLELGCAGHES